MSVSVSTPAAASPWAVSLPVTLPAAATQTPSAPASAMPTDTVSLSSAALNGAANRELLQLQQQIQQIQKQLIALEKAAPSAPGAKKPTPAKPAPVPAKPAPKHAPAKPGPTISTDRAKIYMQQPNGWSCAPTSLTMALAAWGVRPANMKTWQEMLNLTHESAGTGLPGNASLIAEAAKQVGMQATFNANASPANIRAALKQGHGVVLNGSLGIGGHFIYVGGLNANGTFKIYDPYRPSVTAMNDAQLNYFANQAGPNPHGYAEIWKA